MDFRPRDEGFSKCLDIPENLERSDTSEQSENKQTKRKNKMKQLFPHNQEAYERVMSHFGEQVINFNL